MKRRPGGVRKGKGAMVEGEGLGEGGVFAVAGVLEADFEGGEGMAGGGKLVRVCNIYPIWQFCHVLRQYHGRSSIRQAMCLQHKNLGTNKYPGLNKRRVDKPNVCTRCPTID